MAKPRTKKEVPQENKIISKKSSIVWKKIRTDITQGGLFVIAKYLAFLTFSAVSTLLSLNMFYQLVEDPIERTLLTITAAAIEIFKIYKLVQANTLMSLNKRKNAIKAYLLYGFIACASLTASYGFTLNAVTRGVVLSQTSVTGVNLQNKLDEKTRAETQLARVLKDIDTAQSKLDLADKDATDWSEKLKKVSDVASDEYKTISAQYSRTLTSQKTAQTVFDRTTAPLKASKLLYEKDILRLGTEITNLTVTTIDEKKASTSTSSMFALMAQALKGIIPGVTDSSIRFALLLLISCLIEVGIVSTSPRSIVSEKYLHHFINIKSSTLSEKEKKIITPPPSPSPRSAEKEKEKETETLRKLLEAQGESLKRLEASIPSKPVKYTEPTSIDSTIVSATPVKEAVTPIVAKVVKSPPPEKEGVPTSKKEEVTALIQTEVPLRQVSPDIPSTPDPQPNAPIIIYRLGKTTEAVKNQFVSFVNDLFKTPSPWAIEQIELAGNLHKPLGKIFLERLTAIKGTNGIPLVVQNVGEKGVTYTPNFTKDYIINYATARKEQ